MFSGLRAFETLGRSPVSLAETRPVGWATRRLDVAVYVLILGIGALEIYLHRRSDFYFDDYGYVERGLSLLRHHVHGFNGAPELVQPPGLPVIIAAISALIGSTYPVMLGAMAVFGTLSLLLTYELLRREEGRELAAAACVLLASSAAFFFYATRAIYPCYPYMLGAVCALLAARKTDLARGTRARVAWAVATAVLVVSALMIESRGIALLSGLLAWMAASFVSDRPRAVTRLLTFLPVLVLGTAVQGWWMQRAPSSSDWALPGYPASYLSQMKLKVGNFPELGLASPGDWVARVGRNLEDGAHGLSEMLTRHWIDTVWSSPAISGMILLALLGVGYSLWRMGGRLMDWYFLGAGAIYLLWSWSFDLRFFLPATPFVTVYVWRGLQAARWLAARKPRATAALGLAVSIPLGIHSSLWAFGLRSGDVVSGGLQADLSALVWMALIVTSGWMAWAGRAPFSARLHVPSLHWLGGARAGLPAAGAVVVLFLVAVGVVQQVDMGWSNTHLTGEDINPPDVEGARWIAAHTSPDAVVLARHYAVVYYYSHRNVQWFPPISRPDVLLEGIRKRYVNYVLVVERQNPFYLPSDVDCFKLLLHAHPEALRLAASGPKYGVYEVVSEGGAGEN